MVLPNTQHDAMGQPPPLPDAINHFGGGESCGSIGGVIMQRAIWMISPSGCAFSVPHLRPSSPFEDDTDMELAKANPTHHAGHSPPRSRIPSFSAYFVDVPRNSLERLEKPPLTAEFLRESRPVRIPFILEAKSYSPTWTADGTGGEQPSQLTEVQKLAEILEAALILRDSYDEVGEQVVQLFRFHCPTQLAAISLISAGKFWQYRRFERRHMPTDEWQWKTGPEDWSSVFMWLTPDSEAAFKDAAQQAHDILVDEGMRFVDIDM